jgi:hypothetical protein
LGFSFDDIIEIVMSLTPKEFYKSMTTYAEYLARRLSANDIGRGGLSEIDSH